MTTPVDELPEPGYPPQLFTARSSDEEGTFVNEDVVENGRDRDAKEDRRNELRAEQSSNSQSSYGLQQNQSQSREQGNKLNDELAMLEVERVVSNQNLQPGKDPNRSLSMHRSRSRRSDQVDEFDIATNPLHEKTAIYRPPEHPSSQLSLFFKRIHHSSWLVRYFVYIMPLTVLLLIPLLIGALLFKKAQVGGVRLLWFSIWLEIVWLTLWAGRIVARLIPWPLGLISSIFTNNSKKWRDMGKQLEVPATLFFWWLGVEISFLPTMKNHHIDGDKATRPWEITMNKIIISIFTGVTLNFAEKVIIQLIAISFHLRTYADRIELNKFQIGSLTKLYQYSKEKIQLEDSDFEDQTQSGPASGARTPMQYVEKAQKNAREAMSKVGDVAGKVAGDFTGKQVKKSSHPHQVVLMLLHSTSGSQVLARRLYRTFAKEDCETVFSDDLKHAFESNDEAEAAFSMFDKDLNGDISMEELEAVCVEIGRERKAITASLKDLDSVVSKLDSILLFIVLVVTFLVFISIISTSASGVLTSAGSAVLALSWLFSATAQEFLQSVIFVFVKHPFDVGDRVTIYGNTGSAMKGDDYFVKEISLLYTEFKKMEGHVVQAPNSYLNTLFILNMRRSGGLAEAVPLTVKFGTTLDQVDELRQRLLEFAKEEKREYQANILTEIRDVVEAYSVNLNVIFFYKSNWQNEGLRLQRRNKFICALMISMQEIGIEGPRMRLPGATEHGPFYQHLVPRGTSQDHTTSFGTSSPGPHSGSLSRETPFVPNAADGPIARRNPSILRHPSTSRTSRARGESISSMSKRVDFSLGMKDISSGNMMGDVFEDNNKPRLPDMRVSSTSRSRVQEARITEEEEEEYQRLGQTISREGGSRNRFRLRRSSTESQTRLRRGPSMTHKNRFFGRLHNGKHDDDDGADEDLMEQGLADIPETEQRKYMDPRSGTVTPQAVRVDTESSSGKGSTSKAPAASRELPAWEKREFTAKHPGRSQTQDFEMRRLDKK